VTIVLALAAAVAVGTSAFLGGLTSRHAPPLHVSAVAQLVALLLAVPLALLKAWERVTNADLLWSLASGIAAACALGLFYQAMARGLISVVVPVTAVVGAALPVGYGLITGERPSVPALVGIVLALIAVAVVSATPGPGRVSTAIVLTSVGAGICFGAFVVSFARVDEAAGLWPIPLSRFASFVTLAALTVLIVGRPFTLRPRIASSCVAIGLCEVTGIVTLLLALQRGPVAIASILYSLYPVTAGLLAAVVLNERLSRAQLVGVGIALFSLALISIP
jgi:drug/metabolite transporter (DMT)-like permease